MIDFGSTRTIAGLVVAASLVAGCSGGHVDGPGRDDGALSPRIQLARSSLQRFESCDEVRAWARDELAPRVGAYGFAGGGGRPVPLDAEAAEEAAVTESQAAADEAVAMDAGGRAPAAPRSSGAAGSDTDTATHSDTNVQVEGVDEPDIVKTDGERILAVSEGRLHLASAARGRVEASLDLPDDLHAGEILLSDDRALVVASGAFGILPTTVGPVVEDRAATVVPPEPGGTRVVQVDIGEGELTLADSFLLDGTYVSARMTDDVVRLVLHSDVQTLPFVTPAVPTPEAEREAQEHNRQVVEDAAPEAFLPRWRQLGAGDEVVDEGPLVGCDQAHAPRTFSGFGMVAVVSVDLSEGLASGIASANGAGVMAGGQTVYASPQHLYVAAPQWVDWTSLPTEDARTAEETHGTDIHRFDISDPTRATYEMSGHVDGQLLNQFAMDEHNGYLRVATTTGQAWLEGEGESESHVVVLAPDDGVLAPVGTVSGLGRGEQIVSVRFLGEVGYVVTFEQTDPLYTVDLSDPSQPRVVGELEMLGFSAYLHPMDDGRLIGVGQDATEDGALLGTQVVLFDVRDPAAPTRVAQAALPGASSQAEWDHRAFLWWPDTSLVALPVSTYEAPTFEGLVGYRIDVDSGAIDEIGRVAHPVQGDAGGGGGIPVPTEPTEPAVEPRIDGGFAPEEVTSTPPIVRSLVIGDRLWTLSPAGLASSDLATLTDTAFVPF